MDNWVAFIIGILTVLVIYVIFWSMATFNPAVKNAYETTFCTSLT
jgi:hypothetical protein